MRESDLLWLRLACESAPKRPRVNIHNDWVLAVSEGRSIQRDAKGRLISCCADLGHWWLTRLGFRRDWLNRRELPSGWIMGVNVGRLCARPFGSRPEAEYITINHAPPDPGSVLTVDADDPHHTHVCCCLEWGETSITVAEYGQPGAAVNTKTVGVVGNRWQIGDRILHSCLRPSALGESDEMPDFPIWVAAHDLPVPVAMLDNPEKAWTGFDTDPCGAAIADTEPAPPPDWQIRTTLSEIRK